VVNVRLALNVDAFVDISRWWPKDDDGEPLSVYEVHRGFEGTSNQLTRHTLTVARDGKLAKADIINIVKLARICTQLSGQSVTVNDIIRVQDD
jgi:DNA-binding Xre family transcriptional regulator